MVPIKLSRVKELLEESLETIYDMTEISHEKHFVEFAVTWLIWRCGGDVVKGVVDCRVDNKPLPSEVKLLCEKAFSAGVEYANKAHSKQVKQYIADNYTDHGEMPK